MIFIDDGKIYARVWEVTKKEKYMDVRISTSEKNQSGDRIYSNWFARLIGHAMNSVPDLDKGDTLLIKRCKLSNEKYTAKDGTVKSALNFLVIECEKVQYGNDAEPSAPAKQEKSTDPDDLPF